MHFGVVPLLTKKKHPQNFEVFNDAIILRIEDDDFQKILNSHPQLGVELSRSLSKEIQSKAEKSKTTFERKIISIYSPIKGSGVSTYAVNLALSLQNETRKKVVFVNIATSATQDPSVLPREKDATPQWKNPNINVKDISDDYDQIIQSISAQELNIDLLNVCFDSPDEASIHRISQCVTVLVNNYDYVVVDLPNEMDTVVLKTLMQSDIIQLLTRDSKQDLHRAREVVYQLEEELRENFDREKIQVILSDREEIYSPSYEDANKELDFDIFIRLPYIKESELKADVVCKDMSVLTPDPESAYALTVRKITREISDVSVGLVLGGGAALGFAHIGVLRVLERENIPIDIIVGSSIGALLSSLWVTGKNADDLAELAHEFKTKNSLLKLFDPVFPISGIIGGRAIKRWLKKNGLGTKTFYSTRIPLKIVAYDLKRRREIVLDSGLVLDAVRKSIAIPGVIEPVREKDKVIIDGGVLNPLPTNVLKSLGIKRIIAVNVLQSPEHVTQGYLDEQYRLKKESRISFIRAPLKFIRYRFRRLLQKGITPNIADIIVNSLQASEYVIAEQSSKSADVVIHPDLSGISWFELYKVDELIKLGEDAAEKALPAIKQLVAG
jgi:NTE family protein